MKNTKKEEGTLGSRLNEDVLTKLSSKKTELKQQEHAREEEAKKQRLKERKQREANKSFEELLNESELDWKSFKS